MQVILQKKKKSALIDNFSFTLRQTAEGFLAFPITFFFSFAFLSQGRVHYKSMKEEYQYHL